MGKRSNFERNPRDYYKTWDKRAVSALLPHLAPGTRFIEPCAGDGTLANQLMAAGHLCEGTYDIEPQHPTVQRGDALVDRLPKSESSIFITNPPWDRKILHPLITHLSDQAPTVLLFDADWIHTKQAIPFLPRLRKVISVGRLRWIEGSTMDGKDNCAWFCFGAPYKAARAADFYGRAA
jgi:hypothetical protein